MGSKDNRQCLWDQKEPLLPRDVASLFATFFLVPHVTSALYGNSHVTSATDSASDLAADCVRTPTNGQDHHTRTAISMC